MVLWKVGRAEQREAAGCQVLDSESSVESRPMAAEEKKHETINPDYRLHPS